MPADLSDPQQDYGLPVGSSNLLDQELPLRGKNLRGPGNLGSMRHNDPFAQQDVDVDVELDEPLGDGEGEDDPHH